jgi:hypothetical protein
VRLVSTSLMLQPVTGNISQPVTWVSFVDLFLSVQRDIIFQFKCQILYPIHWKDEFGCLLGYRFLQCDGRFWPKCLRILLPPTSRSRKSRARKCCGGYGSMFYKAEAWSDKWKYENGIGDRQWQTIEAGEALQYGDLLIYLMTVEVSYTETSDSMYPDYILHPRRQPYLYLSSDRNLHCDFRVIAVVKAPPPPR